MANIILSPTLDMDERMRLMQEDAAFDVADGEVPGEGADYTNASLSPTMSGACNIAGTPKTSGAPKVPKVFVTNNCLFDCQYCGMRCSKEKRLRYVNKPRDVAEIAVKNAKSNGHGVFISSSIFRSPDYTEELIIETLRIIRTELYYRGYVHAKIMPGADPRLIEQAGFLADRISVNIELSHSDGYSTIAKQKTRRDILAPMAFIHQKINEWQPTGSAGVRSGIPAIKTGSGTAAISAGSGAVRRGYQSRVFARSGQTTQVMVGAMGESDFTLITLAEALYKKFALRRVYYAAFGVPNHRPSCLPTDPTPRWRTRRLYQADRLLQLYGFSASDLLSDTQPFLDPDVDPKAGWALQHLSLFPVEIQKADYEQLIRVPGLGITSANRIINERRHGTLTHADLRKMGVWMNRARFFITCGGKYDGHLSAADLSSTGLACTNSARTDSTHFNSARFDSARFNSARADSARFDSDRFDSARADSARFDSARADSICNDLYGSGSDLLRLLLQDGSEQLVLAY